MQLIKIEEQKSFKSETTDLIENRLRLLEAKTKFFELEKIKPATSFEK